MTTLAIQLTPDQKDFLEHQAAAQGLAGPEDYVRKLIQDAQSGTHQKGRARAQELVLEGLDSGPPQPIPPGFWKELEEKLSAKYPGDTQ